MKQEEKIAESDLTYKQLVRQEQESINQYLNQDSMFTVKKNQLFTKKEN